ncbi:TPA: DUF1642 domain-containing protein [Enterococcus faecium]
MNKQELIEKLEVEINIWGKYPSDFHKGVTHAYKGALSIVEQLDDSQQSIVPQFVADWFEENKDDLDNAIFGYLTFWEERYTNSVLYQWFAKSENNPIETLVRMKDGYEVEKDPVWAIKNADGNYLTKCALWGKDGVNYSFECNPSHRLLFTDKATADAAALLVNGTVEEVVER